MKGRGRRRFKKVGEPQYFQTETSCKAEKESE